jgi:hypothetical protein
MDRQRSGFQLPERSKACAAAAIASPAFECALAWALGQQRARSNGSCRADLPAVCPGLCIYGLYDGYEGARRWNAAVGS